MIQRLDGLARRGVLDRDQNRCRKCRSERVIQWSHWPSRSYHATRWRPEGAVAHCSQCHISFTYAPLEHEAWMVAEFGEPMIRAIKRRALDGASGAILIDLVDVWRYLVERAPDTTYGTPLMPENADIG